MHRGCLWVGSGPVPLTELEEPQSRQDMEPLSRAPPIHVCKRGGVTQSGLNPIQESHFLFFCAASCLKPWAKLNVVYKKLCTWMKLGMTCERSFLRILGHYHQFQVSFLLSVLSHPVCFCQSQVFSECFLWTNSIQ